MGFVFATFATTPGIQFRGGLVWTAEVLQQIRKRFHAKAARAAQGYSRLERRRSHEVWRSITVSIQSFATRPTAVVGLFHGIGGSCRGSDLSLEWVGFRRN